MRDLTDRALDTAAQLGAEYADVRVVRRRDESIAVKSGRVEGVAAGETRGLRRPRPRRRRLGLRELEPARPPPRPTASPAEAVRIAKASRDRAPRPRPPRRPAAGPRHLRDAGRGGPVRGSARAEDRLPPRRRRRGQPGQGRRRSPRPATTPSASGRPSPRPTAASPSRRSPTSARASRPTRSRATSTSAGATPTPTAARSRRPASSTSAGSTSRLAPRRIGEEAVALLSAPQCPSGRFTIVLDPSQLYMQVHESCGHPSELDRVYGTEASYAGTSFLTTDKLDEGFRYGSDLVDIVADATAPGGMGTFGWDDEGVAAQSVPLVRNGIFVGYLSSRETAPRIGRQSGGAMRADGWNRIPLIRMTNVNLLPKPGHEPRRHRRRHRRRLLPRLEPVLVDRRPPPELPVRDRGRLRDQGRQEGPALQEPDVHRDHVRVLAILRRGRRRIELRDARHAELRQGRARPGRAASATPAPGARFRNVQVGVGKW